MHVGTVVWFSDNLGYGFLRSDTWDEHVFIHYSKIITEKEYKSLNAGDVVKFVGTVGERGAFAIEVVPVGTSISKEKTDDVEEQSN